MQGVYQLRHDTLCCVLCHEGRRLVGELRESRACQLAWPDLSPEPRSAPAWSSSGSSAASSWAAASAETPQHHPSPRGPLPLGLSLCPVPRPPCCPQCPADSPQTLTERKVTFQMGWFRKTGTTINWDRCSVHSPVLCCVWTPVGSWYQLLCPLQLAPLCRFSMVNFSYILRVPKPPWREVKESRPERVYFWWLPPLAPHLSFYPPKCPPRRWVGELGRCARRVEGGVHIAWVHTWSALWWISLTMTDRNGVSYTPAVAMCVCYTLVC